MVSIDWLTLNMAAPEHNGPLSLPWNSWDTCRWHADETGTGDVYTMVPTTIRTSQFGKVTYMMDHQRQKVATIWSEPHQAKNGDPWMQVQFANETLYSGEWLQIYNMHLAIGCTYRGISRLDLACDGLAGDGGDWPKVVQEANSGMAKYYGHCDWLARSARGKVIGAEFGSRASNKFIRAYAKKKEMHAKGVKDHIVRAWCQAFGWNVYKDPNADVNRFEVQLKGKEIRRYFPSEGNPDWLAGLYHVGQRVDVFASMAPSMFDFRTVAKYARDAVPTCTWNWSCVSADTTLADRKQRSIALNDHTVKVAIRSIHQLGSVMGDQHSIDLAAQYAQAAGQDMLEWYYRKRHQWDKDLAASQASEDQRTHAVHAALRRSANA
jgi:hypothetical protein